MKTIIIYFIAIASAILIIYLAICYVERRRSKKNRPIPSKPKPIVSETQINGVTKYAPENASLPNAQVEVFDELWNITITLNETHSMYFYLLRRKEDKLTLVRKDGKLIGCLDGTEVSFSMLPGMKHSINGNSPAPANVEFFSNEVAHVYVTELRPYDHKRMHYHSLVTPCGIPTS